MLSAVLYVFLHFLQNKGASGQQNYYFVSNRNPIRFGSHPMVLQYRETHLCSLMGCFTMSCAFCFGVYKKLKGQTTGDL